MAPHVSFDDAKLNGIEVDSMAPRSGTLRKFSFRKFSLRKKIIVSLLAVLLVALPLLAVANPDVVQSAASQIQQLFVGSQTSSESVTARDLPRGGEGDILSQRLAIPLSTPVPVSSETELRTAINAGEDYIELTQSFTAAGVFAVGSHTPTIVSDVNGPHTITRNSGTTRHFTVGVDGSLTLGNIILEGDHENVAGNHGGVGLTGVRARLTLNDGAVITGNRFSMGGGVDVNANQSTLIMNAGSVVTNNRANTGGGVRINSGLNIPGVNSGTNPPVTINPGATISYNQAGTNPSSGSAIAGGGIWVSESSLVMNGGSILNNTSMGPGGAISFTGQTSGPGGQHQQHFTMNDGLVDGNVSHGTTLGGGAFSITTGIGETLNRIIPHYNFYGGTVSNNRDHSTGWRRTGGGMDASGANRITIDNIWTGNRSENGDGGAFSVSSTAGGYQTVIIRENAEITYNFSHGVGGAIYLTPNDEVRFAAQGMRNHLYMHGGTIAYNTTRSGMLGGGIYLEHMQWNIPNPEATNLGLTPGMHWSGAGMTFHGGEIRNNGYTTDPGSGNATVQVFAGGGVYVRHFAEFVATGQSDSAIAGNRATLDGGGIFTEAFQNEPILARCSNVHTPNGLPSGSPITEQCNLFPYHNLVIDREVAFAGNIAGRGSFANPNNPEGTNIDFPLSGPSVFAPIFMHTLNNADINYRRSATVVLHKTLTMPEDVATPSPLPTFDFTFTPVQFQLSGGGFSRPVADFQTLLASPQTVALNSATTTTASGARTITGTLNVLQLLESLQPFPGAGVFAWTVSEVDGSSGTTPPLEMTYDTDTHFQLRVATNASGNITAVGVFELDEISGNLVPGNEVASGGMSFVNNYTVVIPPPEMGITKTLTLPEGTPLPTPISFDFQFTPVTQRLNNAAPYIYSRADQPTISPNPITIPLSSATATTTAGTTTLVGHFDLGALLNNLTFPGGGIFVWNLHEIAGSSGTVIPSTVTYDQNRFQIRVHVDRHGTPVNIEVIELELVSGSWVPNLDNKPDDIEFVNVYRGLGDMDVSKTIPSTDRNLLANLNTFFDFSITLTAHNALSTGDGTTPVPLPAAVTATIIGRDGSPVAAPRNPVTIAISSGVGTQDFQLMHGERLVLDGTHGSTRLPYGTTWQVTEYAHPQFAPTVEITVGGTTLTPALTEDPNTNLSTGNRILTGGGGNSADFENNHQFAPPTGLIVQSAPIALALLAALALLVLIALRRRRTIEKMPLV